MFRTFFWPAGSKACETLSANPDVPHGLKNPSPGQEIIQPHFWPAVSVARMRLQAGEGRERRPPFVQCPPGDFRRPRCPLSGPHASKRRRRYTDPPADVHGQDDQAASRPPGPKSSGWAWCLRASAWGCGCPFLCEGLTSFVSTAVWAPRHTCRPFATTSIAAHRSRGHPGSYHAARHGLPPLPDGKNVQQKTSVLRAPTYLEAQAPVTPTPLTAFTWAKKELQLESPGGLN